jgi:hypothetical protein
MHVPEVTHCSKQTGVLFPWPVHARKHVKQVVTGSGAEAGIAKQNSINTTPMTKRFMGSSSFFETFDFSNFPSPFERWQKVL